MLDKLENLHSRLMDSAGEMWIENNEYFCANKDKMNYNDQNPTPEYRKYREMTEREDILFKAARRVKDAIAVIEEAGLAS